MTEFLTDCFSPVNATVSVLMVIVLCYWALVIFGALGLDAIDFDFDADVDVGIDLDGGADIDVGSGGLFASAAEFLQMAHVPVVIVATCFVFSMWLLTINANYYFNQDESIVKMLLLSVPILIISTLATRLTMIPFAKVFKNYDKAEFTRDDLIGQIGIVKTSEVTSEFGQIEIQQAGPPLVLNVRTKPGTRLGQGDAARIVSFNNSNDTFIVELSKWEKT